MQIAVIGSGYVGLVAAACFAELGHKVVCVDNDLEKIEILNSGGSLIHEDYLQELLSRHRAANLTFSASLTEAVRNALVVVIPVGTPASSNGEPPLSSLQPVPPALPPPAHHHTP